MGLRSGSRLGFGLDLGSGLESRFGLELEFGLELGSYPYPYPYPYPYLGGRHGVGSAVGRPKL